MARKKETDETAAEGILTSAAKTVGKLAGKAAGVVGATAEIPQTEAPPAPRKSMKIPKLAPKNKSRLPRKEKKEQQKALNAVK